MSKNIKLLTIILGIIVLVVVLIPSYSNSADTYYQYVKSGISAFPES